MPISTPSRKVSVLIPTYKYARYLTQAIDSVLNQSYENFELLISDDGSNDGSAEIIRSFASRDKRIRFEVQSSNLGMAGNWNWCLQQATGDYIKYLFGDDFLISRDALARLVGLIESRPNVALAATARIVVDADSRPTELWNHIGDSGVFDGTEIINWSLRTNCNLIGEPSVVMFRRERATKQFDPTFKQVLDWDFWIHLLQAGALAYTDEPLCAFRRHSSQQSEVNRLATGAASEHRRLLERYARYFVISPEYTWESFYRRCRLSKKCDGHPDDRMFLEVLTSTLDNTPYPRAWYRVRHRATRISANLHRMWRKHVLGQPLDNLSWWRIPKPLMRPTAEWGVAQLATPDASTSEPDHGDHEARPRQHFVDGLRAAYKIGKRRGVRRFLAFHRQIRRHPPPPLSDRVALLADRELRLLHKKRLAFVLPVAAHGGGARVVLTEARHLRSLGVDCWIINLEPYRADFEAMLTAHDVPTTYVRDYQSIRLIASEFDAVVATAWSSTQALTALASLERRPRLAYYVQDYEPHFYVDGSDEYRGARASYHLPAGTVLFTKTRWNQQEVYRHEGVRPAVIGPSYDPAEFNLEQRVQRDSIVRICAMVRPETPRRAPQLTMRVLKALKQRFSKRIHIAVFGCTTAALGSETLDTDFEFEHAGLLNGSEVAQLLRRSDLFLDLSTFQAMGLTAMEAMACGVAVIGPERGGLTEIIEHGVSGLLIDTLDEAACVAAASTLIEDPASIDRLATAGVSSVMRYVPHRVAARLARLLLLRDAHHR